MSPDKYIPMDPEQKNALMTDLLDATLRAKGADAVVRDFGADGRGFYWIEQSGESEVLLRLMRAGGSEATVQLIEDKTWLQVHGNIDQHPGGIDALYSLTCQMIAVAFNRDKDALLIPKESAKLIGDLAPSLKELGCRVERYSPGAVVEIYNSPKLQFLLRERLKERRHNQDIDESGVVDCSHLWRIETRVENPYCLMENQTLEGPKMGYDLWILAAQSGAESSMEYTIYGKKAHIDFATPDEGLATKEHYRMMLVTAIAKHMAAEGNRVDTNITKEKADRGMRQAYKNLGFEMKEWGTELRAWLQFG